MPVRAGTLWDGVHLDVPVGNAVAVWRLISVGGERASDPGPGSHALRRRRHPPPPPLPRADTDGTPWAAAAAAAAARERAPHRPPRLPPGRRRRRRFARPRARRALPLNTTHCGGRHEEARPRGRQPGGGGASRRAGAEAAAGQPRELYGAALRGDGWCSGSSVTVAATEHGAPDKRRSRSRPQPSLPGDKRRLPVESGIPGCPPPAGLCSGAAGSPGGEGGPGLSAAAAAALFTAPPGSPAGFAKRLLGPFLAPLFPKKNPLTLAAGGGPHPEGKVQAPPSDVSCAGAKAGRASKACFS